MEQPYWRLMLSYPAAHYPRGDAQVCNAVGSDDYDSGLGFGLRDMDFFFSSQAKADAALESLKAAKLPFEVTLVHIEKYGSD